MTVLLIDTLLSAGRVPGKRGSLAGARELAGAVRRALGLGAPLA
jgi:hypothetical protein